MMALLGFLAVMLTLNFELRDEEDVRLRYESLREVTVKVGRWGR